MGNIQTSLSFSKRSTSEFDHEVPDGYTLLESGDSYKGPLDKKRRPSGKGILLLREGECFVGHFRAGLRHGRGLYVSFSQRHERLQHQSVPVILAVHMGHWQADSATGTFRSFFLFPQKTLLFSEWRSGRLLNCAAGPIPYEEDPYSLTSRGFFSIHHHHHPLQQPQPHHHHPLQQQPHSHHFLQPQQQQLVQKFQQEKLQQHSQQQQYQQKEGLQPLLQRDDDELRGQRQEAKGRAQLEQQQPLEQRQHTTAHQQQQQQQNTFHQQQQQQQQNTFHQQQQQEQNTFHHQQKQQQNTFHQQEEQQQNTFHQQGGLKQRGEQGASDQQQQSRRETESCLDSHQGGRISTTADSGEAAAADFERYDVPSTAAAAIAAAATKAAAAFLKDSATTTGVCLPRGRFFDFALRSLESVAKKRSNFRRRIIETSEASESTHPIWPLFSEGARLDSSASPTHLEFANNSLLLYPYSGCSSGEELCRCLEQLEESGAIQPLPRSFLRDCIARNIDGGDFLCLDNSILRRDFKIHAFGKRDRILQAIKLVKAHRFRTSRYASNFPFFTSSTQHFAANQQTSSMTSASALGSSSPPRSLASTADGDPSALTATNAAAAAALSIPLNSAPAADAPTPIPATTTTTSPSSTTPTTASSPAPTNSTTAPITNKTAPTTSTTALTTTNTTALTITNTTAPITTSSTALTTTNTTAPTTTNTTARTTTNTTARTTTNTNALTTTNTTAPTTTNTTAPTTTNTTARTTTNTNALTTTTTTAPTTTNTTAPTTTSTTAPTTTTTTNITALTTTNSTAPTTTTNTTALTTTNTSASTTITSRTALTTTSMDTSTNRGRTTTMSKSRFEGASNSSHSSVFTTKNIRGAATNLRGGGCSGELGESAAAASAAKVAVTTAACKKRKKSKTKRRSALWRLSLNSFSSSKNHHLSSQLSPIAATKHSQLCPLSLLLTNQQPSLFSTHQQQPLSHHFTQQQLLTPLEKSHNRNKHSNYWLDEAQKHRRQGHSNYWLDEAQKHRRQGHSNYWLDEAQKQPDVYSFNKGDTKSIEMKFSKEMLSKCLPSEPPFFPPPRHLSPSFRSRKGVADAALTVPNAAAVLQQRDSATATATRHHLNIGSANDAPGKREIDAAAAAEKTRQRNAAAAADGVSISSSTIAATTAPSSYASKENAAAGAHVAAANSQPLVTAAATARPLLVQMQQMHAAAAESESQVMKDAAVAPVGLHASEGAAALALHAVVSSSSSTPLHSSCSSNSKRKQGDGKHGSSNSSRSRDEILSDSDDSCAFSRAAAVAPLRLPYDFAQSSNSLLRKQLSSSSSDSYSSSSRSRRRMSLNADFEKTSVAGVVQQPQRFAAEQQQQRQQARQLKKQESLIASSSQNRSSLLRTHISSERLRRTATHSRPDHTATAAAAAVQGDPPTASSTVRLAVVGLLPFGFIIPFKDLVFFRCMYTSSLSDLWLGSWLGKAVAIRLLRLSTAVAAVTPLAATPPKMPNPTKGTKAIVASTTTPAAASTATPAAASIATTRAEAAGKAQKGAAGKGAEAVVLEALEAGSAVTAASSSAAVVGASARITTHLKKVVKEKGGGPAERKEKQEETREQQEQQQHEQEAGLLKLSEREDFEKLQQRHQSMRAQQKRQVQQHTAFGGRRPTQLERWTEQQLAESQEQQLTEQQRQLHKEQLTAEQQLSADFQHQQQRKQQAERHSQRHLTHAQQQRFFEQQQRDYLASVRELFLLQLYRLSLLRHPNILLILGVAESNCCCWCRCCCRCSWCCSSVPSNSSFLYIVTEYTPRGTLQDCISTVSPHQQQQQPFGRATQQQQIQKKQQHWKHAGAAAGKTKGKCLLNSTAVVKLTHSHPSRSMSPLIPVANETSRSTNSSRSLAAAATAKLACFRNDSNCRSPCRCIEKNSQSSTTSRLDRSHSRQTRIFHHKDNSGDHLSNSSNSKVESLGKRSNRHPQIPSSNSSRKTPYYTLVSDTQQQSLCFLPLSVARKQSPAVEVVKTAATPFLAAAVVTRSAAEKKVGTTSFATPSTVRARLPCRMQTMHDWTSDTSRSRSSSTANNTTSRREGYQVSTGQQQQQQVPLRRREKKKDVGKDVECDAGRGATQELLVPNELLNERKAATSAAKAGTVKALAAAGSFTSTVPPLSAGPERVTAPFRTAAGFSATALPTRFSQQYAGLRACSPKTEKLRVQQQRKAAATAALTTLRLLLKGVHTTLRIARGIAMGCAFLHRKGVCNISLNCSRVMLDEAFNAKILPVDFELLALWSAAAAANAAATAAVGRADEVVTAAQAASPSSPTTQRASSLQRSTTTAATKYTFAAVTHSATTTPTPIAEEPVPCREEAAAAAVNDEEEEVTTVAKEGDEATAEGEASATAENMAETAAPVGGGELLTPATGIVDMHAARDAVTPAQPLDLLQLQKNFRNRRSSCKYETLARASCSDSSSSQRQTVQSRASGSPGSPLRLQSTNTNNNSCNRVEEESKFVEFLKIREDVSLEKAFQVWQKASHFLPPESLVGYLPTYASRAADIYSFGLLLYQLFSGILPFQHMTPAQLVGAVGFGHDRLGPLGAHVPPSLKILIGLCTEPRIAARPSFREIGFLIANAHEEADTPAEDALMEFMNGVSMT